MRRILLISLLSVSQVRADGKKGVFRPGDIFDPFRDKSFADHQPSASTVPQHREPQVVFSPFADTSKPVDLVGYPRSIGKVSGNAQQFNAQIWHPTEFFNNIAQFGNVAAQPKPVAAQFKLPENQETLLLRRVDTPRTQVKKFDKIVKPQQIIPYVPTPNEKVLAANTHVIPTPYLTPRYIKPKAPSVANVEPKNVQQASNLVAQSSDFEPFPGAHSITHSDGAGNRHYLGHHQSHGDKEVKGYKSNHHHDNDDHKKYVDHHKGSHHREKGGNHNHHHDEGDHYKNHHEGQKSHKAAKFGEKKGHKRGHKTKGYHNKFHRDEFHREHRFYDDYNKEGYHDKHGDGHSHYKNEEGAHKKGGSHDSGRSSKHHGKKGHSDKGKYVDDNKGFDKEKGGKKYHKHHKEHHKEGDSVKGKKYGYNEEH